MCAIKARFPRPRWAWANQRFRAVAARLAAPGNPHTGVGRNDVQMMRFDGRVFGCLPHTQLIYATSFCLNLHNNKSCFDSMDYPWTRMTPMPPFM